MIDWWSEAKKIVPLFPVIASAINVMHTEYMNIHTLYGNIMIDLFLHVYISKY